MLFILLSIVCTSYLVFAFRVFDRYGVNHFHAIVVNYFTCVVTGSLVNQHLPTYSIYAGKGWFWIALVLGVSFISLFNLMSVVTRRQGVTVTNVATKLSMVIPVSAAVVLYGEALTVPKILGIGVSAFAVYFTSLHPEPPHPHVKKSFLLLPVVLFFGCGMTDSLVKHAQQTHLHTNEFNDFNVVAFSVSALVGLLALLYDVFGLKHPLRVQSIVAGVLLGVPNYFSLFFLIKALELPHLGASVIFPVNNIGIVGFSAVVAWLFFHEKLSTKNWLGLGLAMIAILLMSVG